jgi:putative Mg2+ transporter-C (MgtC) family protein
MQKLKIYINHITKTKGRFNMSTITTLVSYLREFNCVSILIRLLLAVILGGLIGIERSKSGRAAGLRTHILVCLGATVASMTGIYIGNELGGDVSRIAAQVVSGIGWLGAGTILVKNNATVTGLTTAACVWAVGTIGIAIGYGFYEAAIVGVLLIAFITTTLNTLDSKLRHNMKEISVYVEFANAKQLNSTLAAIKKIGVEIENVALEKTKTNTQDGVGAELAIHINKNQDIDSFVETLNHIENVKFAIRTTY